MIVILGGLELNQAALISQQLGGLWLAGNEGMDKNMETAIMGCIGNFGTAMRIRSFIPS